MTKERYNQLKENMLIKHIDTFSKDSAHTSVIALDEIFANLISGNMNEKHYEKLLDKIETYFYTQRGIKSDQINWDKIEEYIFQIINSMVSDYLDDEYIINILRNISLKRESGGSIQVNSKTFEINAIDKIILDFFQEVVNEPDIERFLL